MHNDIFSSFSLIFLYLGASGFGNNLCGILTVEKTKIRAASSAYKLFLIQKEYLTRAKE